MEPWEDEVGGEFSAIVAVCGKLVGCYRLCAVKEGILATGNGLQSLSVDVKEASTYVGFVEEEMVYVEEFVESQGRMYFVIFDCSTRTVTAAMLLYPTSKSDPLIKSKSRKFKI